MAPTIEEWWRDMPKVTKTLLCSVVATTAALMLGIISVEQIYLDMNLVVRRFHIWRTITCFTFFGPISFGWLIQLYILTKYGTILEQQHFYGATATADFVFMFVFGGAVLLVLSMILPGMYFLGPSMVMMLIYVWSRTDPLGVAVFFGFRFKIWQLPFVLTAFHMLLGGSLVQDLAGILAGHSYHFMKDIVPVVYNVQFMRTPTFLVNAFADRPVASTNWRNSQGHRLN